MNHKFEVKFKTEYSHSEYGVQFIKLVDAAPKSLSLSCPHCQVYSVMRLDRSIQRFEADDEDGIAFGNANKLLFDFICSCPSCDNTVFVQAQAWANAVAPYPKEAHSEILDEFSGGEVVSIYPYKKKVILPPEVPEQYASKFRELVLILDLSPTASAALSRRILQDILRNEYGIQPRSLAAEIDDFIAKPGIPSYLSDSVDAIRNVGNFAAHPLKSTNTGEVIDVEPGEAEWLVDVLNDLFDFAFIQPKKLQERRDQLNIRLQELGKPPMK